MGNASRHPGPAAGTEVCSSAEQVQTAPCPLLGQQVLGTGTVQPEEERKRHFSEGEVVKAKDVAGV